jgi:type VI secretion system protein VasJ
MASLDEKALIELGQAPIPGDRPIGIDASDDLQHILVVAEAAKLGRVDAGQPDWAQVEDAAREILSTKSKDLEIAGDLGLALFKQHGYAGLAAGLGLLTALVEKWWDGLYPSRRGWRKARIDALADRFTDGGWFREHPPKADEFDAIDACVTRAAKLQTALVARMPEGPPELAKFLKGLGELAARRPKPASPTAPSGSSQVPSPPPAGAFLPGEVADAAGASRAVLSAATFLRKTEPTDPLPYALVRVVKWSKIALPTSDAAKYEIQPPEASSVDALRHQLGSGLWEHLLSSAEGAFRAGDPLWLDLQRYVCAAMAGLGSAYETARQAVMGLTAALVRRLGPGLYDLKFRGGMPLCGGETRLWIESDVVPPPARGANGSPGANGKLTEALEKARKLAGAGKLKDALTELQDGSEACGQRRDRLLWRLRMGQLCVDAGRWQLALPLLEECHEEIRRYRIDEWERTLAVDVAQTLYRCRKAMVAADRQATPEMAAGVRESFGWLCQLDLVAALALE